MKSKLFIIHFVSNTIQPATEAEDTARYRTVVDKATQVPAAGKFCNTCFTVKRSTLKYLKYSQVFLLLILFTFLSLIQGLYINKAHVIVGIHVWKKG